MEKEEGDKKRTEARNCIKEKEKREKWNTDDWIMKEKKEEKVGLNA